MNIFTKYNPIRFTGFIIALGVFSGLIAHFATWFLGFDKDPFWQSFFAGGLTVGIILTVSSLIFTQNRDSWIKRK